VSHIPKNNRNLIESGGMDKVKMVFTQAAGKGAKISFPQLPFLVLIF
jgi:hypothetical protein